MTERDYFDRDEIYKDYAQRWVINLVTVGIFSAILNFIVVWGTPNLTLILTPIIVLLGLVYLGYDLFKKVDELIDEKLDYS